MTEEGEFQCQRSCEVTTWLSLQSSWFSHLRSLVHRADVFSRWIQRVFVFFLVCGVAFYRTLSPTMDQYYERACVGIINIVPDFGESMKVDKLFEN